MYSRYYQKIKKIYRYKTLSAARPLGLLGVVIIAAALVSYLASSTYASTPFKSVPMESGWSVKSYTFQDSGNEVIMTTQGPNGLTGSAELDWTNNVSGVPGVVAPTGAPANVGYVLNIQSCNASVSCGTNVLGKLTGASEAGGKTYPIEYLFIFNLQYSGSSNPSAGKYDPNDNVLYEVTGSQTSFAPNITAGPYSAPISKATITGGTSWKNTAGTPETPSAEASELEFISPLELFDKQTGAYYTTDPTSGDQFFRDANGGGERFLDDGDTLYWPSQGVQHGSTCYGGIDVSTDYGTLATNTYGEVYLLPTNSLQNNCVFGPNLAVSTYSNQNYDGSPSPPQNANGTSAFEDQSEEIAPVSQKMLYAMFYWESPTTIGAYGGNTTLTAVSDSSTRATILSNIGKSNTSNWQIFSSSDCGTTVGPGTPFLLVNYDSSKVYDQDPGSEGPLPPLEDIDINDSNTDGYIYSPNGSGGWTTSAWSQFTDGCMVGSNSPQYNDIDKSNDNSSNTYIGNVAISVGNIDKSDPGASQPSGTGTGSGTGTTTPPSPTDACDSGGFLLSWFVCPLVNALGALVNFLDGQIQAMLSLSVTQYFSDTGSEYTIWSNMRDIAMSLLVIAALIMVLATALDIGPFDAYTVKKVLPRIILAVVTITFSWQIGKLLIQFSDDLGAGVGYLIYSAASVTQGQAFTAIGASLLAWLGIGAGVAVVAGALAASIFGPIMALTLLLPALLALAIGFFVLVFRRLLLVVCVVFAPLAFVSFVLPGTQKVWALWKKTFTGALFVYPMITGLISLGAILAYMTVKNDDGAGSFINSITAFVFFFGPYFLIPKAVKMSGGAMGAIGNMASNLNKAGGSAINKWGKNRRAQEREKRTMGGGYKPKLDKNGNLVAGRMSRIAVGYGTGFKNRWGLSKQGKERASYARQVGANEMLKDPFAAQAFNDDDVRNALMAGSEARARAYGITDESVLARARAINYSPQSQLAAMLAEGPNKGRVVGDVAGANRRIEEVARASGVDAGVLRNNMSYAFRQSGAWHLGALDGSELGLDRVKLGASFKAEYDKAVATQTVKGLAKGNLYQLATGTDRALKEGAKAYETLGGVGSEGALAQATFFNELKTIAQNSTGLNGKVASDVQASQRKMVHDIESTLGAVIGKTSDGRDIINQRETRTVMKEVTRPADPTKGEAAGTTITERLPFQEETTTARRLASERARSFSEDEARRLSNEPKEEH